MEDVLTIQKNSVQKNESYSLEESNSTSSQSRILFGWSALPVKYRMRLRIFQLAFQHYGSFSSAFKGLKELLWVRQQIFGKRKHLKAVQHGNKFYLQVYAPAFPSKTFDQFVLTELNRVRPIHVKTNRLNTIFFAITKKCPLQCEHCFEWNELNKKEALTYDDLQNIAEKFLQIGISKIVFSGGEPTVRFEDLLKLNRFINGRAETWVYTSGFNLHREKIRKLKNAGVTGLIVSVDHFDADEHNHFRGNEQSFLWIEKCLSAARAEGMIVAMSICITRKFLSEKNLDRYVQLAHEWGASFVQLLEPKAVGHYAGKDVLLNDVEKSFLEKYYLSRNDDPVFAHMPVIEYHGYHERKVGCQAAGRRFLYVNTDGEIQPCPFCQSTAGKVLDDHFAERIARLSGMCNSMSSFSDLKDH